MPTYDYECSSCGHRFEIFEGVHEGGAGAKKTCPGCGRKKAGRLMGTGAGFIFKGSGFYVTDYKKSGSGGGPPAPAKDGEPAKPASKPADGAKKPPADGSGKKKS